MCGVCLFSFCPADYCTLYAQKPPTLESSPEGSPRGSSCAPQARVQAPPHPPRGLGSGQWALPSRQSTEAAFLPWIILHSTTNYRKVEGTNKKKSRPMSYHPKISTSGYSQFSTPGPWCGVALLVSPPAAAGGNLVFTSDYLKFSTHSFKNNENKISTWPRGILHANSTVKEGHATLDLRVASSSPHSV